jgi:hypothetical protein
MGESAKRFPTRAAIQANKKGRDELRHPHSRSLTTRRVSLDTQLLGVDCVAYLKGLMDSLEQVTDALAGGTKLG